MKTLTAMPPTINKNHTNAYCQVLPVNMQHTMNSPLTFAWSVNTEIEKTIKHWLYVESMCTFSDSCSDFRKFGLKNSIHYFPNKSTVSRLHENQ